MEKNSVGFQLRTLGILLKRKIDSSEAMKRFENVTGMQRWVVKFIADQQQRDVFQKDIEELMSIRRSTATKLLQLTEKNGLITREPVAYDARLKRIKLTPKSLELHQIIMREIELLEVQIKAGITDEEMDHFFNVVQKMKRNIE
jgi:DNA-binding MarR family transcriptional regulator